MLAELALRLIAPQSVLLWQPGPFIQDGDGFFRLRPGHFGRVTNRTEFDHEIRINAAGLRGGDPAQAAGCRVLAAGDSFTFGLGVEEHEVFHQLAAEQLRESGVAIEVLNGGIPAIGVPQEVRWIERHGLRLDPDLVLLAVFIGNDLRDAKAGSDHWTVIDGHLAPPGGGRRGMRDRLYERSHLFVLGKNAVLNGLRRWLSELFGLEEPWSRRYARETFAIYHRSPSPVVREGLARTEQALDRLMDLADRHGFRVVATLIPDVVQVEGARWQAALEQLGLQAEAVDAEQPGRWLQAAFERRGIPVLDHAGAFRARIERGEELYFPADRHWNRDGHRLAGTQVAELLRRELEDGLCSSNA